jgi:hypothetical protein
MSHEALEKTNKGRSTFPNVWFVGVTPRRNPELVVAVLWQNGEFSYYPARIGAKVVEAFVNKKRRLAGNLPADKAPAPVDVGAVWTEPNGKGGIEKPKIHSGHFYVDSNGVVAGSSPAPKAQTHREARPATARAGRDPEPAAPVRDSPEVAALTPALKKEH